MLIRRTTLTSRLAWLGTGAAAAALVLSAATLTMGCGRTPDFGPRPPIPNLPSLELVPVFTQTVNNDIDIVFMIDNSGSMKAEQDNLRRNFPAFTRVLKDLPQGLPNVHIGVVSSDLGAGMFKNVSGCGLGDGGRFQNTPRAAGCTGPRGSYISAVGSVQNFDGDIDDVFSCIAALGTNGCGFEHQLQSVRVALDPDLMPVENRDFLREEALLAIVLLTDEDDCSAPPDTTLFDPSDAASMTLGPLASFRCNQFGHICDGGPPLMPAANLQNCHSAEDGRLVRISELISFFKGLKADPNDVIVAAITGPASPYSVVDVSVPTRGGGVELETQIAHSCISDTGGADPAVRIQQFVNAFGNNGIFLSICAADLTPAMQQIGSQLARRASLECLDGPVADIDAKTAGLQPHCQVYDETGHAGATLREAIPACTTTITPPCWRLEESTKCLASGLRMVVDRGGLAPPSGTRLNVACETCADPSDSRCK